MAFELTVDGYTFDNPPSNYRKRIDIQSTPQPHFRKLATPYYHSDSKDIVLEVDGRVNLNDSSDLTELERLQEIAIENGEVEIDFDPFFSGVGVLEDDPFTQENQRGRYQMSFHINEETTNAGAYPAHATPTTGNTFELGSFDFGFDPESVEEEYTRQTETVDRLSGVSRTVDTKGLVTRVSLDGRIDGGGQQTLWEKAKTNAISYLSAEFQNGWALVASLDVSKDRDTPDYLQGLFKYSAEFLIVKDPSSGIGEVSSFIDHNVRDLGTYTSDGDSGSGTDEGGLDFKVRGGTGSIDGDYVSWVVTTVTLDDNTTNYVFVEDPDGDGYGEVVFNTNGFPSSGALALYEVDTSNGDIVDVRDVRDSLINDSDTSSSDLVFSEEFSVDDSDLVFARIMALGDEQIADPTLAQDYLGLATLSESIADPTETLSWKGFGDFGTETFSVQDGGSASTGGGSTVSESNEWGTASDWDAALAEAGVVHEGWGDNPGSGVFKQGYPSFDRGGSALMSYYPMDDSSGPLTEVVSGDDASELGSPSYDQTGVNETSSVLYGGANSGDGHAVPSNIWDQAAANDQITLSLWVYPNAQADTGNRNDRIWSATGGTGRMGLLRWEGRTEGNWLLFDESDSINGLQYAQNYSAGSWYHVVGVYDGSDQVLYVNGSEDARATRNMNLQDYVDGAIGANSSASETFDGQVEDVRVYSRGLSASEVQALYDAGRSGSLTTDWKTFSGDVDLSTLELTNVVATLNSQTVDVYVESDTSGDGNVDETSDVITLDGSGGPYTVSGLSTSNDKFRLRFELSSSLTRSPTVDEADLSGDVSGVGQDNDQNPNTTWTIFGAKPDTSGNEYEGGGVVTYPEA